MIRIFIEHQLLHVNKNYLVQTIIDWELFVNCDLRILFWRVEHSNFQGMWNCGGSILNTRINVDKIKKLLSSLGSAKIDDMSLQCLPFPPYGLGIFSNTQNFKERPLNKWIGGESNLYVNIYILDRGESIPILI